MKKKVWIFSYNLFSQFHQTDNLEEKYFIWQTTAQFFHLYHSNIKSQTQQLSEKENKTARLIKSWNPKLYCWVSEFSSSPSPFVNIVKITKLEIISILFQSKLRFLKGHHYILISIITQCKIIVKFKVLRAKICSHSQKILNFLLIHWQETVFQMKASWSCPKSSKFLTVRPSNGDFLNYSLLLHFKYCRLFSAQITNCRSHTQLVVVSRFISKQSQNKLQWMNNKDVHFKMFWFFWFSEAGSGRPGERGQIRHWYHWVTSRSSSGE